jgi:hypothetical protein
MFAACPVVRRLPIDILQRVDMNENQSGGDQGAVPDAAGESVSDPPSTNSGHGGSQSDNNQALNNQSPLDQAHGSQGLPVAATAAQHGGDSSHPSRSLWTRIREATGTVYGDIGTSVLYTVMEITRETIRLKHGHLSHEELALLLERGGTDLVSRQDLLGGLSLIFWALIALTVKYDFLVMRTVARVETSRCGACFGGTRAKYSG